MFKKNDPLVDSVRAVMEHNAKERQIEAAVNEEFGVTSKNALPHEVRAKYEQRLAEAKKCMYEAKPLSPKQKEVMDVNKNNKIDSHDLKLKRAGLEEKWKEELEEKMENPGLEAMAAKKAKMKIKKKEKLEERAKEPYAIGMAAAMKSTGDKPPLEKSTIKKAHDIAKKVAKKEGKKLEEQEVFEEIRSNLEEQLVSVYESGDEAAFADFVSSLSEEQIDILGLNEADGQSPGMRALSNIGSKISSFFGGGQPTAPTTGSTPSFAGARDAAAGAKSTMDFKTPSTPSSVSPSTSVADRISSTSHMGAKSTPSTPQTTPSILQSTNKAGERLAAGQNQADMDAKAKVNASRFGKGGPGGAVAKPGATPAGDKIAPQVAAARGGTSTPTAPTSTGNISKTPRSGMKSGMRPGMSAKKPMTSANDDTMANIRRGMGMFEETETPSQVKESFEHFIRNKFLKG